MASSLATKTGSPSDSPQHTRTGADKNLFFLSLMISIDGSLPLEFAAVCHTSLSLLSLIHLTNGGR
jgi:hypothetical protein